MERILLKDGLIMNIENGNLEKNDLFIEDGKIQNISKKIELNVPNLQIINLNEAHVIPGLIDCHTHIGIIEEGTGKLGIDNNETSDPITPHLRGLDGINPLDIAFSDAVRTGVTCVMSGPGSNNAVGGQNVALKTYGQIIDKMIFINPLGVKIALGEDPISTYGTEKKCPVTRMGTTALIRELFMRAQDYMANKENGKLTMRDIRLEAIIPVLKGDIFLRAHAHRADDIVTAIRIAEEFNINKLVIEHGTEAHLVKEYLREKNVPVVFGPMLTPRIKMELNKRNYKSALKLIESGVKIALMTDHPYNSIDQLRSIAILANSEGVSDVDCLKCITLNPAEIMGCADKIGKLQVGYDADIAILNGSALDVKSKVIMTIINGEIAYDSSKDGLF